MTYTEYEDLSRRLRELEQEVRKVIGRQESRSRRMWSVVTKGLVPVILPVTVALLFLWRDVAVIQATRFTAENGADLYHQIQREFPPEELKAEVREIRNLAQQIPVILVRVEQNAKDIKAISDKVDRHMGNNGG